MDHASRRVIDLLPERSSDVAAAWLRRHPSVALVTRDRSGPYAKAVTEALPGAVQVADRWHLCVNLREALVRLLDRRHADVTAAAAGMAAEADAVPAATVPAGDPVAGTAGAATEASPPLVSTAAEAATAAGVDGGDERTASKADALSSARRTRRLARYEQVVALKASGLSTREVARRLRMGFDTVRKFLRAGSFPERARHRCTSRLDRLAEVLKAMWDGGTCNAAELFRRLRDEHGFKGKYDAVRRRVARWSRPHPVPGMLPPPPRRAPRGAALRWQRARPPRVASKRLAWLLAREEGEATAAANPSPEDVADRRLVAAVRDACPEVRAAADLVRAFNPIMRERSVEHLNAWISRARQPEAAAEVRSFADGLLRDWPCVSAAMAHAHSNGRAEGHVNRLKLIKRKMYGRAKLDLLRIRVLANG